MVFGMNAHSRSIVITMMVLFGRPGMIEARPPATPGDPPPARTPEEVTRLPRRSITKHGPTGPFTVNIARREEGRKFFNTVYAASEGFSLGGPANLATCTPGTTDAAFRDLVALRINYFRAMAGVPAAIVFDSTFSTKDQSAALMVSGAEK